MRNVCTEIVNAGFCGLTKFFKVFTRSLSIKIIIFQMYQVIWTINRLERGIALIRSIRGQARCKNSNPMSSSKGRIHYKLAKTQMVSYQFFNTFGPCEIFLFEIKEAQQEAMDLSHPTQYADLPPLIPLPVERMQATPALAVTPAPASSPKSPAIRPNQLDLGYPTRPARHLRPPSSPAIDSASQRSVSPGRIFLMGESLTTAFRKI